MKYKQKSLRASLCDSLLLPSQDHSNQNSPEIKVPSVYIPEQGEHRTEPPDNWHVPRIEEK